jgi:hypothetical protein
VQIKFQNCYPSQVNVAAAVYDANCQPPWESKGGGRSTRATRVHVANTCNGNLCFYAEAADGVYSAGPYQFEIAESAFDFRPTATIGFSGATVGMRLIDGQMGGTCWRWDSYTTLELVA